MHYTEANSMVVQKIVELANIYYHSNYGTLSPADCLCMAIGEAEVQLETDFDIDIDEDFCSLVNTTAQ